MATQQKRKLETFTTPAGIAKFPRLNKPETEVNGKALETPRFKTTIVFDESDPGVEAFKAKLEAEHDKAIAIAEKARKADPKRAKKPLAINETIKPVLDADGNEVEGKFEIVVKTQAVTRDGTPKVIRMFSASGKPVKANVGGGSTIKANISLDGYDSNLGAGLSLYLNAIQIIDLTEFGGGDASSYGFGKEEGYEASGDEGDSGDEFPADAATGGDDADAPEDKPKAGGKKRSGDF